MVIKAEGKMVGGGGNVDRIWMKEVGGGGQPNGQEEE
jgi:hypothetical protein